MRDAIGLPPFWQRPPGFGTLLYIILEQQVSLASARAAYERLNLAIPELTPAHFLDLNDESLHAIGFSRQKTAYGRGLARAVIAGELDLDGLESLEDDAVQAALVRLKGIGSWTAETYLLMALCRSDAFPAQDLAVIQGVRRLWALPQTPDRATLLEMAEAWRPWRAAATRMIWHAYLSRFP